MYLANYLSALRGGADALAESYRAVAAERPLDADVHYTCLAFARQCDGHGSVLAPALDRYVPVIEPDGPPMPQAVPGSGRPGPIGLLHDLQALHRLAGAVEVTWTLVGQAARGARDRDLLDVVTAPGRDIAEQLAWLRMRMKAEAAQALLITPE